MKRVIYIAGPMSGHPLYNFPAFDEARDRLREQGYEVVSPADLDRSVGFDPANNVVTKAFLDSAMERDICAIMRVDCMVMLPGWQHSTGARAEYALARWRHIPVYQWPEMEEVVDVSLGDLFMGASLPESAGKVGVPDEVCDVKLPECAGTDPKAQAGSKKCPMWLLPPVALEDVAWVHQLGADKYGAYNWRYTGICSATYISAIMRHLMAIAKGEWLDPESGKPHAAHIACSCNILMDADHHGKLDR